MDEGSPTRTVIRKFLDDSTTGSGLASSTGTVLRFLQGRRLPETRHGRYFGPGFSIGMMTAARVAIERIISLVGPLKRKGS